MAIKTGKMEIIENGITGAPGAAAALELNIDDFKVHPTLLAAQKVMNQAIQGMWYSACCLFVCSGVASFLESPTGLYIYIPCWCYLKPKERVKG